jgi:hypothetical protein
VRWYARYTLSLRVRVEITEGGCLTLAHASKEVPVGHDDHALGQVFHAGDRRALESIYQMCWSFKARNTFWKNRSRKMAYWRQCRSAKAGCGQTLEHPRETVGQRPQMTEYWPTFWRSRTSFRSRRCCSLAVIKRSVIVEMVLQVAQPAARALAAAAANSSRPKAVPNMPQPPSAASLRITQVRVA